jgi:Secretion system C-terminal sorting domain
MKRFFRLLFAASIVLVFRTTAFSQISITASDLMNQFSAGKSQEDISAGDTAVNTMNVGTASSSSSQSWSFPTSAKFIDTSTSLNVDPSSTPYAGYFPLATNALVGSQSGPSGNLAFTSFLRIVNDSLISLGSVENVTGKAFDTTIFSISNKLVSVLPINLGYVSKSRDSLPTGPGSYEIQNTTETYDAYGTIVLPIGSFSCLRTTSVNIIEFHESGGSIPNDTIISFTWYTKEGHQCGVTAVNSSMTSGSIQVVNVSYTELVNSATSVPSGPTGVAKTFSLAQNYPNPFNPSTQIQFSIPQAGFVSLKVYDMLGREVATLVHQELTPSSYSITWNAANVASGVYLYKLDAGNYSVTKKMVLMK